MKEIITIRRNNGLKMWELLGERTVALPQKNGKTEAMIEKFYEKHILKKGVMAIYNRCFSWSHDLQVVT